MRSLTVSDLKKVFSEVIKSSYAILEGGEAFITSVQKIKINIVREESRYSLAGKFKPLLQPIQIPVPS